MKTNAENLSAYKSEGSPKDTVPAVYGGNNLGKRWLVNPEWKKQ